MAAARSGDPVRMTSPRRAAAGCTGGISVTSTTAPTWCRLRPIRYLMYRNEPVASAANRATTTAITSRPTSCAEWPSRHSIEADPDPLAHAADRASPAVALRPGDPGSGCQRLRGDACRKMREASPRGRPHLPHVERVRPRVFLPGSLLPDRHERRRPCHPPVHRERRHRRHGAAHCLLAREVVAGML